MDAAVNGLANTAKATRPRLIPGPDGTAAIVFKGSASGGRGGTNVESHALCLAVTKQDNASYGQIYPGPLGFLKQPTASGKRCLGSHSTTSGRKMQAAIVAKKTT